MRHGGHRARLHRAERIRHRRGQRLARQRQIDRPARAGHHDLIGARHHVDDLLRDAQLVIPLHRLAQHPGLVEHLLAPVDVAVAAAELALLGDRRASRGEDQRNAVAVEIDDVVDRVGGADVDVQHHALRLAAHRIGAMRHRHREVLVRDHQRRRYLGIRLLGAAVGLDDRREIGARIGEEIVDAVVGQRPQEGLSRDRRARVDVGSLGLSGHFISSRVTGSGRDHSGLGRMGLARDPESGNRFPARAKHWRVHHLGLMLRRAKAGRKDHAPTLFSAQAVHHREHHAARRDPRQERGTRLGNPGITTRLPAIRPS